jgi:sialate O-acetylesterase
MYKKGLQYAPKMKALIDGWRRTWGLPEMPFYYVQIAPWSGKQFKGYHEGQLPAVWEAQASVLKLPNTGMAVITDLVDDIDDLHPKNKHDVGKRLALWALAKTYSRKDIVYSGPLYESLKIEGNKTRLSFAHAQGLKSRDGKPLSEFKIAGADGKFVDATAEIDGDTVVVHAESVEAPQTVRFGWHKMANPNLVNGSGLPASPFQTDNWQGGTGEESN